MVARRHCWTKPAWRPWRWRWRGCRRTAIRGQQPQIRTALSLRLRPASGEVEWWLASTVNLALFQAILDAFATRLGAGNDKSIVLALDNAGWHVSDKLKIPDGLWLCLQPPYSPELQPAERLGPLADEAVANKPLESLEELGETLERPRLARADQPAIVSANTPFHWWPAE